MSRKWVLLACAIAAEVAGTLALRATVDRPALAAVVVVGYAAAYYLLALALRAGMSLGAAYGIWGALGVALVTLLGTVVFGETLSTVALLGIGVIIAGVVLVETGARPVILDEPTDTGPEVTR
ncbi:DMT family transporter [Gordonia caeni]|uniref:Spermidine export protein MdtJ n=1 Tax=Gordonia caeni TaxID=1007097 RepID=A0ABP7NYB9_9ACTN